MERALESVGGHRGNRRAALRSRVGPVTAGDRLAALALRRVQRQPMRYVTVTVMTTSVVPVWIGVATCAAAAFESMATPL